MEDGNASCDVDGVIITGELDSRPSRAPDYHAENQALTGLAEAMSTSPGTVLQRLVELAMELTRSDSAGISLLEPGGENGKFRWVATAGAWSPDRDGTMPREASPCGEVIARETVLLMKNPERSFPALLQAEPGIGEGLLAPFQLGGVAAGTVWTIKHSPDDHFDAEDARLIQSLARFASAAQQTVQALEASDERQAFLLQLSDAMRPLSDPIEIQEAAVDLLGAQLQAHRVYFFEAENDGDTVMIRRNYVDGVASTAGPARMSEFDPQVAADMHSGRTTYSNDVEADRSSSPAQLAALRAAQIRSWLAVPLVKGGHLVAALGVNHAEARRWTEAEITLVEDVAERTWAAVQQAQAEAALIESEAKYRTLFEKMHDGFMVLERIADDPVDYRIVVANSAYEIQSGLSDPVGKTVRDIAPTAEEVLESYRTVEETGLTQTFTAYVQEIDRWFDVEVSSAKRSGQIAVLFRDITERRFAEETLRVSEERQAFLLKLSDALRPLSDTAAIQDEAMRTLGEHLKVSRAFYSEVAADGDVFIPGRSYNDGVAPMPARSRLSDFGDFMRAHLESGPNLIVEDALIDDRYAADHAFEAIELRAGLGVPLVKSGRLLAIVSVHQSVPRAWTAQEIDLVEETAERTWAAVERARVETSLQEKEERQAFLLKLSDALRPLADPVAIMAVASERLGRHLDVGRCGYGEVDVTGEFFTVGRDWTDGVMASFSGRHRLVSFGPEYTADYRAGRTVLIDDALADARAAGAEAAFEAAGGVRASLGVPLIKDGRFVAGLFAQQLGPRQWTAEEEALALDVADRTWAAVERARAEQAMRDSEERFRTVTEAIDDVFYMTDLDREALLYLSPSFESVWGRSRTELLRDLSGFGDTICPEDRSIVAAAKARQQEGEPVATEYRIVRPDGSIRWIYDRCFPVPGDGARRSAGIASDITERKEAEAALHDSEARFRQFSDASTNILWIRDAETLRMMFASPAFDRIYGIPGPDRGGDDRLRAWARLIEPEDRAAVLANFRRVRAGERIEMEFQIRRASDGALRWIHNTDFPLRDAAGVVRWIAGLGADITDAKEAADRQGVLIAELQHRTRNLIAVVRSLSDRTLGNAASLEDFGKRFRLRLSALSRVQGLLSHLAVGERAAFDELLRTELAAHGATDGMAHKVTLNGPAGVPLRSGTVQTLALALHELATNAVKYGALAAPNGHLNVDWHVEPATETEPPRLHVDWRESGVVMPELSAPSRGGGYGRELIERALPYQLKAKTSYELGEDGVRCTIAVPVSRAVSEGVADGE